MAREGDEARRNGDVERAARLIEGGGLPLHSRDVVSAVAETPVRFRYVYPPHTLPVMAVLTHLPLREASLLWLALKGVLICALFLVWMRILPEMVEPVYLLVAVLAFNGAILADLIAGNISLLEQVILWSGFLMLRRNLTVSALLIAAGVPSGKPCEQELSVPFEGDKPGDRGAVFCAGRLTPELGDEALRDGKLDFVGMTRRLIADHELPNKVAAGRADEIRPCCG